MSARIFLYNILILTVSLLALPWVLYQLLFVPKRRQGLVQRFGRTPVVGNRNIWCHAVSVGEVRAISPLLKLLQEDERARDRVILSTVTVTGQETANRECGFVRSIFYFPMDLPFAVSRSLKRVKPVIFITAETEIWPNFFSACFKMDIPVVIVNGRISDSSLSRYLRFRWFFRPILERVSLFLMQSEEDARRITEIGARPQSVKVTGNMKYDREPEPVSLPEEVERWARSGFLLVAGSTHAGEEEIVLEAVKKLSDKKILIALVPRHPERFEQVAGLIEKGGAPFTRYTEILAGGQIEGDIILVDAMGVLDGFYALGDVAFVGGSLVPVGGHNLLEPAMHGIPVLTGRYISNFRDIADALGRSGGCWILENQAALSSMVTTLYDDISMRTEMGTSGRQVASSARGASKRNSVSILEILGDVSYLSHDVDASFPLRPNTSR